VLQEIRAEEPILPLRLFRNRTISVAILLGLLLGIGMFGAIAFLPLYLQVVKGVSATESGLRTTPMMLGLLSMSVFSGMLMSKTGRYRVLPIVGTAIVSISLLLISRIGVTTSLFQLSLFMLLLGVGLGLVMQVIQLAVQNAAPYRDMGTATAAVNFFRSMGGALGVAIFGSILSNRLDYYLPRLLPVESLNGLGARALTSSPQRLRALPPDVLDGVRHAFMNSLHAVFLVSIPIAVTAFLIAWLLPESLLRGKSPTDVEAPAENRETRVPVVVDL
jgi:MFS family permease